MEERIYSDEVKKQYENLQNAYGQINLKGVTILTGNNGCGKSLIRKQLPFLFKKEYNLEDIKDTAGWIKSTSMDARTESRPEFGALSSALHDTSWIATSQNTFSSIKGLINAIKTGKKVTKYLVIDEYEIGCGEETIIALAKYISDNIQSLIEEKLIEGAMIITHSKLGLEHIAFDYFINLEGKTKHEWVNRKLEPTDLEKLAANELFFFIRDQKEN